MLRRWWGAAALAVAVTVPGVLRAQSSAYEQLQTFSGLLSQIRLNYVDSVTTQQLVRGAIDGMLASLDPHSYFLSASEATRLDQWRSGQLAATGIVVDDAEGTMTVLSVYPRSPAAGAGIAAGDRILTINDTSVAGLSVPNVQTRLIGERGSRVRLLLERGPRLDPETVTVRVRNADIRPQTVTVARTLPGGVGYVRLSEFMVESGREVERAIDRVATGNPRRVVLDLRGNPGGAVVAAVDVASLFFARGQVVFRSRGRRRDIARDYLTERDGPFRDAELIVLIDEHSASASEALTGSLQDHDRALVLGRRSFGKALMQMPFMVPPAGDAVWLTVGWIVTPSGRLIQRRYKGLGVAQYYQVAGHADSSSDTTVYRTDGGRIVRAGGGILPDSLLPGPAGFPAWWTAAADSGFLIAVADSIALTLPADVATRERWLSTPAEWQARLLPAFLSRVRSRLGIRAEPDEGARARMARVLAARVAEVRWNADADDDLRLRNDPDVAAALVLFPRIGAMLGRR